TRAGRDGPARGDCAATRNQRGAALHRLAATPFAGDTSDPRNFVREAPGRGHGSRWGAPGRRRVGGTGAPRFRRPLRASRLNEGGGKSRCTRALQELGEDLQDPQRDVHRSASYGFPPAWGRFSTGDPRSEARSRDLGYLVKYPTVGSD